MPAFTLRVPTTQSLAVERVRRVYRQEVLRVPCLLVHTSDCTVVEVRVIVSSFTCQRVSHTISLLVANGAASKCSSTSPHSLHSPKSVSQGDVEGGWCRAMWREGGTSSSCDQTPGNKQVGSTAGQTQCHQPLLPCQTQCHQPLSPRQGIELLCGRDAIAKVKRCVSRRRCFSYPCCP